MDRRPADAHPELDRLALNVKALERRQQRGGCRMTRRGEGVERTRVTSRSKPRGDEADVRRTERLDARVEVLAPPEGTRVDDDGGDAGRPP
jgi:hypothetical protein